MMFRVAIKIPGIPIAKKRPRFARKGNFVSTYNDQQTEEGKFLFYLHEELRKLDFKMIDKDVPIILSLTFGMPIPKSTSKKKAISMRQGIIEHTKKPDLDNLIKFVKDCLNGVVWYDDSQVVDMFALKKYMDVPVTHIIVYTNKARR